MVESMITRVRTFDKIAPAGLSLFGEGYAVSAEEQDPQLIVARSSKVDTDLFPSLRAVARAGAGTDSITVEKASARGIPVFTAAGCNAQAVAELVFAALSGFARNLPAAWSFMRSLDAADEAALKSAMEKQKSAFKGAELKGKTLALLGLGRIGVLVAGGGIARGMRVVGYDPQLSPAAKQVLDASVQIVATAEEAVKEADVVSIHVPLLDATRGMVNEKLLSACKQGAILLNYSRGEVCDEAAVIAALDSKKLRGYLTDFPTLALLKRADVFATPHLGASTFESEDACAVAAVGQLKRFIETGDMTSAVNAAAIAAMK